jgi:hypothetical protein
VVRGAELVRIQSVFASRVKKLCAVIMPAFPARKAFDQILSQKGNRNFLFSFHEWDAKLDCNNNEESHSPGKSFAPAVSNFSWSTG